MPSTPRSAGGLLRAVLLRQRRAAAGGIALITLWQVCEAGVPVLIGVFIDQAVQSASWWSLALWSVVLCAHFTVLSLAYRFGSRLGFGAVQREAHRLRTEVAGHVLSPRGARTGRLPGEVLSIATADADQVGRVIQQVVLSTAALVGLAVSGIVLATIDPLIAVLVLAGVPVVLVCTQLLAPRLAHRSALRQESLGLAVGRATDLVRGIRPLKGIGGERVALERYRGQSRDAVTASVSAARWEGAIVGVTDVVSYGFLALVALVAGLRALDGTLGIGELVAVVGLAQFVAEPMALLAHLVAQVSQSRASAERIVGLLAAPPLVLVGTGTRRDDSGLVLESVTHGVLREVSLTVAPGATVAVSATPEESTALMRLLRGEAAPEVGRVLLDGTPLVDLPLAQAHPRMLVADHHIDVFEGSLRHNLDPTGRAAATTLEKVLDASAAADLVAILDDGLDSHLLVGGTTLSGGQRQRLGLARALIADPDLMVLHEPTTAVDALTEQRIADGVRARRAERGGGTLVITNSPALLAIADVVIRLHRGRVVARGPHADLLADAGYREAVLR